VNYVEPAPRAAAADDDDEADDVARVRFHLTDG